ncbi:MULTISPECIES: hypothetical protein [Myxococcus]|uniref:Uncharacterized protein n=1 Tax=Myxococcus xanthus TaxID=34 RepID=A0AAE6G4U0_MYXXA|nr:MULTISPECIES: hypothetical protein [Myxococcus]QDE70953.1 hypothetical protein BHS09_30440 [Myxococcus xanthus]QDE78232.1 hypothetical protein BHS08_30460 [Myxococcus xanthus]QDE85618.1 hypothetical protein BHS07_31040 [Myxococcus xanthus]QDE99776.1 hypothetical protein BHS05_30245 [Myxococcus xanthus]QDF07508.1 hypothetical protein BHS04_30550 [Myxococcus xanthus]
MKKTQVELESRVIVGAHGVAAEEDHLVMGKVVGIGVGSLLIFGVGIVWAWWIQVQTMADIQPEGPPPRPAAMGQYEVGIVNQRLFEQDWHAEDKISGQDRALRAGWGDQPGVKQHPGIDAAMKTVIEQKRNPPPTPAPETAPGQTPPAPQQ